MNQKYRRNQRLERENHLSLQIWLKNKPECDKIRDRVLFVFSLRVKHLRPSNQDLQPTQASPTFCALGQGAQIAGRCMRCGVFLSRSDTRILCYVAPCKTLKKDSEGKTTRRKRQVYTTVQVFRELYMMHEFEECLKRHGMSKVKLKVEDQSPD